jgi:hypothetical protein
MALLLLAALAPCVSRVSGVTDAASVGTLVANPASGSYGQTVSVTGTKFAANEGVNIYWGRSGTTPRASATTDATGAFSASFSVPDATFGAHKLIAVGQTSAMSSTASFQVLPRSSLRRSSGLAGSTDAVYSHGFAAHETVHAYWGQQGGLLLGTGTSSALGALSGASAITFTVPVSPAGTYPIVTVGATSGAMATTPYTVT